eukprot:TRINITY_DN68099_c0_g1_i1.p1 TRINITY_DN68099_c0_g1~~TRINITY_DN68099_c0_g1_i1.p1  ORF type:complete len:247 (+),score=6.99 TRINITY_DN68099_c0_g1_i1:66-806(+)
MITTDDVVRMAIEDIFPGHFIPDQDNYLPGGDQFKAPDHSILDGRVLIERKSRNVKDDSQFYEKILEIARSQGVVIGGYGMANIGDIIKILPNPDEASKDFTDYFMNKALRFIKEASRKFQEYANNVDGSGQLRILIISDNSSIHRSTDIDEYFIGRRMIGLEVSGKKNLIDSVIFVKNPEFVFDKENSYWFKCLIRGNLKKDERDILLWISEILHRRIGNYADYYGHVRKFAIGRYRPLIVGGEL